MHVNRQVSSSTNNSSLSENNNRQSNAPTSNSPGISLSEILTISGENSNNPPENQITARANYASTSHRPISSIITIHDDPITAQQNMFSRASTTNNLSSTNQRNIHGLGEGLLGEFKKIKDLINEAKKISNEKTSSQNDKLQKLETTFSEISCKDNDFPLQQNLPTSNNSQFQETVRDLELEELYLPPSPKREIQSTPFGPSTQKMSFSSDLQKLAIEIKGRKIEISQYDERIEGLKTAYTANKTDLGPQTVYELIQEKATEEAKQNFASLDTESILAAFTLDSDAVKEEVDNLYAQRSDVVRDFNGLVKKFKSMSQKELKSFDEEMTPLRAKIERIEIDDNIDPEASFKIDQLNQKIYRLEKERTAFQATIEKQLASFIL